MHSDPIISDAHSAVPPIAPPYARRTVWAVIFASAVIITMWLIGTPVGILTKPDAIGYAICHQIETRSFHAYGVVLPLCARCTGIYLGVLTGVSDFAWRGRLRSARLPGFGVLAVMVLLGITYGLDGLNSYFSIFEFYTPVYEPNNTLRLLTGMTFGIAMITVVLPVFNALAWYAPENTRPVASLRELLVLYAAAAVVALAVLIQVDALLLALGVISVFGVLLMFCIVGTVMFLTLTRRENTITAWRDLALPALAGLTFAFVVIGGIDAVRYIFTGTWDGFTLPGA